MTKRVERDGEMKKGRKWSFIAIAFTMLFIAACGNKEEKTDSVPAADTKPEKVVATSITYPDFLYVLGVTPVAAENYHTEFPSYFNDTFKDVIKLGDGANLEAILEVEPDLIIAPKWRDEKVYDQLSKIAKTVLMPDRDDWRDELRDIGEALGKQQEAEQAISDYEQHMKEAKESLQAIVGDETFIYMRMMPNESYVMGETSSRGKVIHGELGLKPVEAFPKDEGSVAISLEMLPEYNPDHIILQVDGGDNDASAQKIYEDMKTSEVWKGLKAVKENQVYLVGDREWMNFGFSSIATLHAVDEIVESIKMNNK